MAKIEWLIHENMMDQRIECRVALIEGGRSRYAVQDLVDVRDLQDRSDANEHLFLVFANLQRKLLSASGVPAHYSTNPELARHPFEGRRQFNRWLEGKGVGGSDRRKSAFYGTSLTSEPLTIAAIERAKALGTHTMPQIRTLLAYTARLARRQPTVPQLVVRIWRQDLDQACLKRRTMTGQICGR